MIFFNSNISYLSLCEILEFCGCSGKQNKPSCYLVRQTEDTQIAPKKTNTVTLNTKSHAGQEFEG